MSESTENYQGWSNRETWAVALHLNNTQWMYNHYQALMANIKKRKNTKAPDWDDQQFVRFTFEDELKDQVADWFEAFFEHKYENLENRKDVGSMISDVGSVWRVDWREIAKSFLEKDAINPQVKP